MINQYSNIFNQLDSMHVINILEKNKKDKVSTDDYWPRWMNLFKRDFPNLPCPALTIPATTTSPQDINTFKANYYENLYREAEIESYLDKIKLIFWIGDQLHEKLYSIKQDDTLFDLKLRYYDECGDEKPITPKFMSRIRRTCARILTKLVNPKRKESPLNIAITEGYMDAILLLLEAGADATAADNDNQPPIYYALTSTEVNINIVCILLEAMHKRNALNIPYKTMTAAEMVLTHPNIDDIKLIVAKYAHIDFNAFTTAILVAIEQHKAEHVSYLLRELKFDPNMHNNDGPSLLHVYLLLRHKPVENKGYVGRTDYDPEDMTILRAFADAGANFDSAIPESSLTLLMLATKQNDLPAVKFLLDNGANVRLENKKGETAYDLTEDEGIQTLLLEKMMPITKKAKLN
ncbi:MAG: ankyrin repeat domain-containing protein [Gammaproteobacteria bacterium]